MKVEVTKVVKLEVEVDRHNNLYLGDRCGNRWMLCRFEDLFFWRRACHLDAANETPFKTPEEAILDFIERGGRVASIDYSTTPELFDIAASDINLWNHKLTTSYKHG